MGAVIARLIRAEWTKLLTTRVWIGLLLGSCVLVGGFAALFTGFAGSSGGVRRQGLPAVGTPASSSSPLARCRPTRRCSSWCSGIIGTTQEYRHRTATPTFLTSPHRGRVVIAKLLAYRSAAIPMALVVIAVDVLVVPCTPEHAVPPPR